MYKPFFQRHGNWEGRLESFFYNVLHPSFYSEYCIQEGRLESLKKYVTPFILSFLKYCKEKGRWEGIF